MTVADDTRSHRGTIFVEDAIVVERRAFAGDQYVMRLRAPRCAAAATPGSFVHLQCDPAVPMRRPLSIMRVDGDTIEVLFKTVGGGLARLADKTAGDSVSNIGPIGRGFDLERLPSRPLLIGGGVGIPPMVFVADVLQQRRDLNALAILGSEIPFPFAPVTSALDVAGMPAGVDHAMPFFEERGIPSRLASHAGFDGCYRGFVTDVARDWLDAIGSDARRDVEILACGPTPMLRAVALLAESYDLPCQVSLEEYMACAVGGCAGCTVRIETPAGPAMKRVCVDGPVFDARDVAWNAPAA